jgi:hypothetical protein
MMIVYLHLVWPGRRILRMRQLKDFKHRAYLFETHEDFINICFEIICAENLYLAKELVAVLHMRSGENNYCTSAQGRIAPFRRQQIH